MASNYVNVPAYGSASWKDPVPTALSLPSSGNTPGDTRVALDTNLIYIWSGVAWVNPTGAGGVTTLNSLTGALNITAGSGISVTPAGSNIQITNTGGLNTTPQTVAYAATITPASASYIIYQCTMTGDMTLNTFSAPGNGDQISFVFLASGANRTLTLATGFKLPSLATTPFPYTILSGKMFIGKFIYYNSQWNVVSWVGGY